MNKHVDDPLFGRLTYDEGLDWWTGVLPGSDPAVAVHFSADEEGQLAPALENGKAILQDFESWKERVELYAVERLLSVKNESWLDEKEQNITPAEFRQRMRLETITFYPEGDFDFMHDDGGLFWGHAIQICGSVKEGPNDADTPG